MAKAHKPRAGSLQFWPRKRAARILPSVNYKPLEEKFSSSSGLLGFIGYKVGMARALVRDLTPHSLTQNREIVVPITFVELPYAKILSVRFYKNNRVSTECLVNTDKELKRKIKLPKKIEKEKIEKKLEERDYDNIRLIIYSLVKLTKKKKTPDIAEVGLAGSLDEKIRFVKEILNKQITFENFVKTKLVDVVGVTKGKGTAGPVKRFGIGLKQHKSEKGRRRPGAIGSWTPSRVTFRAPMAGQLGFFTRRNYNLLILKKGKAEEIGNQSFMHYGNVKTEWLALKGSLPGCAKRQIMITAPLRITPKQEKKNYEFIKFLK